MSGKHLFEYAVIRLVPRVEREEFINVGVILYCAQENFLEAQWDLDEALMRLFGPALDLKVIQQHLCAFDAICRGSEGAGPIGLLNLPGRFRWLTATRSTTMQCSKVHPGLTANPNTTLRQLMEQLVYRHRDKI